MAYNEIRTINNIQLEDIKARQSIEELNNKKANKSDIVNGLNYKGTTTYSALPTSGNNVGDFYYVTDGDGTNGEGNYAWNGTAWYFSGKTTDFGDISTKANAAVNNAAFEEGKLKVTKNDGTSTETEVVDSSLTKSGKAADAKITGDNISQIKEDLTDEIPLKWEEGAIDGTTGADSENSNTCRSSGFFDFYTLYSISVQKNKRLFAYNDIKEYIGNIEIPSNTTFTKEEIEKLEELNGIVYFRLRAGWGETIDKVDKVTLLKNISTQNAIDYTNKIVEERQRLIIKKYPMHWRDVFYNTTTGLFESANGGKIITGEKIKLSDFVRAKTGNLLFFRVYAYGENGGYLGCIPVIQRSGTLLPRHIYSKFPNAYEIIISMLYSSNIVTTISDVEKYTTVYCSNVIVEQSKIDYWTKYRQRFNAEPIMVAYSNGADLGYMNTELAYINAAIAGFKWLKGDVQPTSDGKLIMCHDNGFTFDDDGQIIAYDETSSKTKNIHDMTYDECMNLLYSHNYHIYTNYISGNAERVVYNPKVCDLEQFLEICKEYGTRPYIVIRDKYMDTVVPELLKLLEKYDFIDNCIVNSFTLDSVKLVANQSNHRVMISVVKEYAKNRNLTIKDVDDILAISPNCTINIYTSLDTSDWNNAILAKMSEKAINYAKSLGVTVGSAGIEKPHKLFKSGIGLMQCSTACIQTKITPINLCISLKNGEATSKRYGAYGAEYTADISTFANKIEVKNVRRIDSTRDFSDGITPNLAGILPYSLNAIGDKVISVSLLWNNVISITINTNIADLDTSSEKLIFVKFAYGL